MGSGTEVLESQAVDIACKGQGHVCDVEVGNGKRAQGTL